MDGLLQALDIVEKAGARLRSDLDHLDGLAGEVRAELAKGTPLRAVYAGRDWETTREEVSVSLTAMNSALRRMRSEAVRVLVDEEGLTIGEAARLIGHPRQLVRRLYDNGHPRAGAVARRHSADESAEAS